MGNIISNKELQDTSEKQLEIFLEKRGIKVASNPREQKVLHRKTADYKFTEDFHIETTIFEGYMPQEIDDYFNSYKENFGKGIMIKIGFQDNKYNIDRLGEFSCDNDVFLLVVQYSPEVFYPKIVRKIGDKYGQIKVVKNGGLICLDFRVAGIDLYSLSELVKSIIKNDGHNYPKLAGILLLSQEEPKSPKNIPDGVLIVNSNYNGNLPDEFKPLLPPKRIEYKMAPYTIKVNLHRSKVGHEFKINNIDLPDGKTLYIHGISKISDGLESISVKVITNTC